MTKPEGREPVNYVRDQPPISYNEQVKRGMIKPGRSIAFKMGCVAVLAFLNMVTAIIANNIPVGLVGLIMFVWFGYMAWKYCNE